jgi:trk system potassium uptake protein
MDIRFIIYVLGKLLMLLAGVMCIPAGLAVFQMYPGNAAEIIGHESVAGFIAAVFTAYVSGAAFVIAGRKKTFENGIREGFAIVTFGWIAVALVGSIPLFVYFLASSCGPGMGGFLACFTNAFFENISGFSGTGSTILRDIEALPKGLLLWRSMTQWLGGMGVATLALAIFPAFGVAAYQMFRGESPGPEKERLTPQLRETANVLWGVYVLFTVLQTVLLYFGGLSLFDAACQSFTTMATGGFSTRNLSVGAFNSSYVEWVTICFMFLAGMNFMIHYRVLFGRTLSPFRENREFHFYFGVILLSVIVIAFLLSMEGILSPAQAGLSFRSSPPLVDEMIDKCSAEQARISHFPDLLRHAVFQVVSITTTTGFCTADFDIWPNFARYWLVVLMFIGGCAGSTSGGIKMVRILVILKAAHREIKTMIQPRLIAPIKIAGKALDDHIIANIVGFFVLFLLFFVGLSAIMCLIVPDVVTAITAVVASMSNIGPGLSGVGAMENYAWIPTEGKWVLIAAMLLGRLEIFTVLIAFAPSAYRK